MVKPLVGDGSPARMRAEDLVDFARWFAGQFKRKRGHAPSERTVKLRIECLTALVNSQAPGEHNGCVAMTDPHIYVLLGLVRDRAAFEKCLDRLLATGSVSTARNKVYALMAFGDYAVARGDIESSVVRLTDVPPDPPPPAITVYTGAEMETLVSAARGRGLRWWALTAALADTGRRIGELLAFEWSWFRLDADPTPFVALPTSKNRTQQYVPLSRRLREHVFTPENIAAMQQERRTSKSHAFGRDVAVFPFPWSYSTAHQWFRDHCARLGIDHRGIHNIRHTVITNRLAAGMPPQAVQALAGHRSLATTMGRYSHATALDYWKYVEGGNDE